MHLTKGSRVLLPAGSGFCTFRLGFSYHPSHMANLNLDVLIGKAPLFEAGWR